MLKLALNFGFTSAASQHSMFNLPRSHETDVLQFTPKANASGSNLSIDGILFRLRSGCPWNKRPSEFGEDSTVHRGFPRWSKNGVMERLWAVMATRCEEPGAAFWKWPAAEGALGQARFGGEVGGQTRPIAANRGRNGACWWTSKGGHSPP